MTISAGPLAYIWLMLVIPLVLCSREALPADFLILGDNQSHQSRGSALAVQSGFVDKHITEVTRRPPGQALYGDTILEAILASNPDIPILHLGDGLDVSCTSEADIFFSGIPSGRRFVMAPGNHDGYFLGNFDPELPYEKAGKMTQESWRLACKDRSYLWSTTPEVEEHLGPNPIWDGRTDLDSDIPLPGVPFSRNDFIRRYLHVQEIDTVSAVGSAGSVSGDLLVAWNIDTDESWQSYLAQLFMPEYGETERLAILVVDTSQARKRPKLGVFSPSVGVTGWIDSLQVAALKELAREVPAGMPIVLAGHHNVKSLHRTARKRLFALMKDLGASNYVSGHSHEGWRREFDFRGWEITELNVGSTLDAPIEYRLATVDNEESRLQLVRHVVGSSWGPRYTESIVDCDDSWRLQEDHLASAEAYAPSGHFGWFPAAHKELDAQLAQLAHQWSMLPPSEEGAAVCYVRDDELLENAKCLSGVEEVQAHVKEVIDDTGGQYASRLKARLFRALQRSYDRADANVAGYELCQAIDSAWRDYFRVNSTREWDATSNTEFLFLGVDEGS